MASASKPASKLTVDVSEQAIKCEDDDGSEDDDGNEDDDGFEDDDGCKKRIAR